MKYMKKELNGLDRPFCQTIRIRSVVMNRRPLFPSSVMVSLKNSASYTDSNGDYENLIRKPALVYIPSIATGKQNAYQDV